MKKLIAISSSIALLIISASLAVNAEEYTVGDVDMDGAITAHDVAVVSRYIKEGDIDLSDKQLLLADYDGNGIVNEADADAISVLSTALLGDVDGDGKISLTDSIYVMRLCAPFNTETINPETIAAADVDADGIITINDSYLILQYYNLCKAEMSPDFGGYYFHWNAPGMNEKTRVPLRASMTTDELKPMNFYGDVNVDNCLNEIDVKYIKNFIETGEVPDNIRIVEADINCDGVIDQKDIDMILENITYNVTDVNKDGKTHITDAIEVLSYYSKKSACLYISPQEQENEYIYNVNGDEKVSILDAVDILRQYALTAAELL